MRKSTVIAIVAFIGAACVAVADAAVRRHSHAVMIQAAADFLQTLSAEQRTKATFTFEHAERLNWHFIPRARLGLPFKEMTPAQQSAARALLRTALSQSGIARVDNIIELEVVLREAGGNPVTRDPEMYFVSVFGTPSASQPWGWRFEGHHLSLNFTIAGGGVVATSPSFLGANPAHVRTGTRQGMRALAAEEDVAREFMALLDPAQRAAAIVNTAAPNDIVTMNSNAVSPLSPAGIGMAALSDSQRSALLRLLEVYLGRMADDIAAERRSRLQRSDMASITFAWAGTTAVGERHYYRIQGPTFLVEYDNTQNGANHIHSVWRDFAGDFGRDLLREHYSAVPHQ